MTQNLDGPQPVNVRRVVAVEAMKAAGGMYGGGCLIAAGGAWGAFGFWTAVMVIGIGVALHSLVLFAVAADYETKL